jgi:hypothetical protein
MKRLIGRTDMEDALTKLDKLTNEEARMAVAQNLKVTRNVDGRVRGVANRVEAIDSRVAGMDDRMARVDDKVTLVDDKVVGIDDRVARVGDRVRMVDNKVSEVIDGTQIQSGTIVKKDLNFSGGREAKEFIQQAANDQDQMKRSSSPIFIGAVEPYPSPFRATNARERSQMALPTGPIEEP